MVSIRRTFVGTVMSLLFNTLSRFVIAFLPRSKRLLILWLQSPSTVILKPKKVTLPLSLLQEGAPLPGPEVGSCLTLGNELSERHMS